MQTSDLPSQPSFARALGPFVSTALVAGTVIGSGIFKKPQTVAQAVPFFGSMALVWAAGGLLTLAGALAYAEIAVQLPRAGGNYVFLKEGLGKLSGFLWGWVELWIIKAATVAALATVFVDSLRDALEQMGPWSSSSFWVARFDSGWEQTWMTVGVIFVLGAINVIGVRWGGITQLLITIIKIGSLAAFICLPLVMTVVAGPSASSSRFDHLDPIWPSKWGDVHWWRCAAALYSVLWAYHGWMTIAPVAEEVRDPKRNIPLALFTGLGLVIAAYLGANLAFSLVISPRQMAGLSSSSVASAMCLRLLGPVGASIASAAVGVSVLGALNGNMMAGPRVLFAMSADRLAPSAFGRLHHRWQTPHWATIALAVWSAFLVVAGATLSRFRLPPLAIAGFQFDLNLSHGKPLFDVLTDFAMFGAVVFETLTVATIFVFRRRPMDAGGYYRCWGYPWTPGIYVAVMALVAISTFLNQPIEACAGTVFVLLGALVYLVASRWD
jgi:amino acid transporter